MKKLTSLLLTFGLAILANAQQTSFETSENYNLGEINGQNAWIGLPPFSPLFVVNDEKASDGNQSLKLKFDDANLIPDGSTMGPIWEFGSQMPSTVNNFEASMDVYFSSTDQETAEFDFYIYGEQGQNGPGASIMAIFAGYLFVVKDYSFVAQVPIIYDQFNNIKVKMDFTEHKNYFYLNNELIHTDTFSNANTVTAYGLYTSGLNDIFVDNIQSKVNTEMAANEVVDFTMTHFVKGETLHIQSDALIHQVQIFDLNGQEIIADKNSISTEKIIDIRNLNSGIYIAKVLMNGKTNSFRFVKK